MRSKPCPAAVWLLACLAGGPGLVPARAQAPQPALPNLDLKALIEEALAANPAIDAARRAVDARRARIPAEKTLPEPMVSFQTMGNLLPPTLQRGDPSSARVVSVEQEFPFPGKLALRGRMAALEAEQQHWSYEQTRRQLVSDLKTACYELSLIDTALETVGRIRALMQSIIEVAESRYRVGQGMQQDVLRAQVELSRLIERSTILQLRREITVALVNSLLARPPDSPLGRLAPLSRPASQRSLEELRRVAAASFPEVKMQEREIDIRQSEVELARKDFYPDFAVGFSYFNRPAMPEMYGLMVSARLPLFFWRKQRPELESAASGLIRAERERDSRLVVLTYRLQQSHQTTLTSAKLLQLYGDALIPQARLSLESATSAYQVGQVDFLTVLDSALALLDYELKYDEALTDWHKALAQLELLTGVELSD